MRTVQQPSAPRFRMDMGTLGRGHPGRRRCFEADAAAVGRTKIEAGLIRPAKAVRRGHRSGPENAAAAMEAAGAHMLLQASSG
jgi:hypothetical protein